MFKLLKLSLFLFITIVLAVSCATVSRSEPEEDPAKFMLNVTYSGASEEYDDNRDKKIPMDWNTTDQHSLSLSMGLNVFKHLSLGVDFGIKDFNVAGKNVSLTDIMNIGGMIGFKWASITIDYRFNNGNVEFPSKDKEKADSVAAIAPNQPYLNFGKKFARIEARTVALMFSTFDWFNLGLMWAHSSGPAMVYNKYFDPYAETDAFGIRANIRIDYFTFDSGILINEKEDIFLSFLLDTTIDLGFGWVTLSSKVDKAIKDNKDKKPDLDIMYNGVRLMAGAQIIKKFEKRNRYWEIIAAGLDVNGGGTTAADANIGSVVIGAFVRMGFAY